VLSPDRETTCTSFSLNIDNINEDDEEEGVTGGTQFLGVDDAGRPSTAADQPATPSSARADSRPATAAAAAAAATTEDASRPTSTAPQDDQQPANDEE